MAPVPESELLNRLRVILSTSDLNTTSAGAVRRQLETDFGVDLSDQKKLISKLIDDIIQDNAGAEELEEQDNKDDVEEEEDDDNDIVEEDDKCQSPEETTKKKRGTGFTRLCSLSPQLHDFVGVSEMARTEVVKRLWAYIRENDLQDPSNRRNIKCDDKLHSIFRVNTINMFQMNKVLSKHIWPLETADECSRSEKKQKHPKEEDDDTECSRPEKKQKRQKEEDDDTDVEKKPKLKAKQQKGGPSGFLAPLQLSEAFVKFLGTGETTLSRAEAVKRIWGYIKENDLQDPSDKRRILCDEKLKELFEVDTFNGFSVSKYLTAHLSKRWNNELSSNL
ncbi:hypothetical protein RND81_09G179800 [Saponaria officinalis]|uniref:Uncharacterized protein n=2 Tax=Saponaria officinalis TaxID=3572 RepID=A0AAW1IP29_SAPOF